MWPAAICPATLVTVLSACRNKYTQKPRAMQEAEGKCKQSLHAAEGLLHCRGATVNVSCSELS